MGLERCFFFCGQVCGCEQVGAMSGKVWPTLTRKSTTKKKREEIREAISVRCRVCTPERNKNKISVFFFFFFFVCDAAALFLGLV
jgi:hypothetical protein